MAVLSKASIRVRNQFCDRVFTDSSLTRRQVFPQRLSYVQRLGLPHCLEPLIIGDLDVGLQIMGGKTKVNAKGLVAKDPLLIAKDGEGIFGMEGRQRLWALGAWLNE